MQPFNTILIANRGEIAMRIIRTARAMGYRTVAVYSDADAAMPYVRAADCAVHIGAAPAAQSYLNIDAVIAAAQRAGATAIHPGYGFLSENDRFAEACRAAGLVFIGPSPQAIRAMADKAEAKRIVSGSGVPCIPGYDGEDQSDAAFARAADRLGYPVMLKATAGGGGKGMRLVEHPGQLELALDLARSEARKAFGDDTLMMEKAVQGSRHVEVQVFGDYQGAVVHLGDRDCSIQRRHQKIIEEAPAPGLPPELRARMGAAGVAAARAIGYVGAGTVEFLVSKTGKFYFLEMNTRLQVEHPVTEMITGLDLVEWQIRVAAGESLPLGQNEIRMAGHAIEARLYAEDPAADFLPESGRIAAWRPPDGIGIRVDHAIAEGSVISTFYDPMVAKVIGFGEDRETARRRLVRALEDLVVAGLRTNRRFLVDVLSTPDFVAAELDTTFLDRWDGKASAGAATALLPIAAALFYQRGAYPGTMRGWRSRPWPPETLTLDEGGRIHRLAVLPRGGDSCVVEEAGRQIEIIILDGGPVTWVRVDGLDQPVVVAWEGEALHLSLRGETLTVREHVERAGLNQGSSDCVVASPMPGLISAVRVAAGELVEKGDVLVVLEAMKMEHPILAPFAGRIAGLHVVEGQQVGMRQILVEFDSAVGQQISP